MHNYSTFIPCPCVRQKNLPQRQPASQPASQTDGPIGLTLSTWINLRQNFRQRSLCTQSKLATGAETFDRQNKADIFASLTLPKLIVIRYVSN
jgi:hypothetical protein